MTTCPLVPRRRPGAGAAWALAIAMAGLACTRDAASTEPAAETSPPPVSDTGVVADGRAPRPGEELDRETARAETKRILEAVAIARNLPVRGDVEVDVRGKAAIREFAKKNMYEKTKPEELRRDGRLLASLGIVPVGADFEDIVLDLLEEGVLGLYDPKVKTLVIGSFVTKGMLTMVVGHEIVHGLQDMHFDLRKYEEPLLHDSDAETARTFLIEGDAQAAYLAWVSGEGGLASIDDAVLDALGDQVLELSGSVSEYPVLARGLQMPYNDGAATVIRLVKKNGWKAVDELYAKVPTTSEQMLHLDKLLANEPAIPTKLDAGALASVLPGLDVVWHDNLGEATLVAMLAEVDGASVVRAAAGGWGGDTFVALDRKDAPLSVPVLAGVIAWDTEADAKQFLPVFQTYLTRHAAQRTILDRKGKKVVFATGVPADVDLRALQAALWRGTSGGS